MYIERPKELFKDCVIKKMNNHDGLIVSIKYDRCGSEVLVKYYAGMSVIYNWFYDFEVELKEPQDHGVNFFKDYSNDRKIK